MVQTSTLKIYVMILIIFNFMAGSIGTIGGEDKGENFDIQNYLLIKSMFDKLAEQHQSLKENREDLGIVQFITKATMFIIAPFIILDGLFMLMGLITYGFTVIPAIFNIILLTPLSIFIIFDYVIPVLRGN